MRTKLLALAAMIAAFTVMSAPSAEARWHHYWRHHYYYHHYYYWHPHYYRHYYYYRPYYFHPFWW